MRQRPTRLVATDLDGTLLRSDGTVSHETAETLAALEAIGITVVFVTARPIRWVRELAGLVHGHGIVICANGAIVYDAHADLVLSSALISESTARALVKRIRRELPGARFAREALSGFGKEPEYPERHPTPDDSAIGPIDSILGDDTVKLLVREPAIAPHTVRERVARSLDTLATTTSSDSSGVVEVSAAGVTKAGALERLCRERGIAPVDVLAFGDMLNDIPMLAWAGTAVAVANAHPDVIAIADLVAPSNDEDGVASILRTLL